MLSPWMLREFFDANQKFTDPGYKVYLRLKNEDEGSKEFAEYGFQVAVTDDSTSGFTDIEIYPSPYVSKVSLHDIGLNSAKLFFGAAEFAVSGNFVTELARVLGYEDEYQVFRNTNVIGLMYNNRLYSIESAVPEATADETIYWSILCNAQETKAATT